MPANIIKKLIIFTGLIIITGCSATIHYKIGENQTGHKSNQKNYISKTTTPVSGLRKEKKSIKKSDPLQESYKYYVYSCFALSDGNINKAKQWLLRAIKNNPDSIYLHKKMAVILKHTKDYEGAIIHIKRCIELGASDIIFKIMLGDLYGMAHKYKLAIKEYNEVLKKDPHNKRIRLLLSDLLIRENRLKEALTQLNILIKEDNEFIIAYYYRGRVNMGLRRYKAAEYDFLKVLEMDNSLEPALYDLCSLYQLTGRYKDAISVCNRLLSFYPNNVSAREKLILLYIKTGQKQKAEKEIKRLKLDTVPGQPERQILAFIYLQEGKIKEAIKELRYILKQRPNDYKCRYYLGISYEKAGDIQNAIKEFNMIPASSKYYSNAKIHIAHMLKQKKRYNAAIALLKDALKYASEKRDLYLMLAILYEIKEDYNNALKAISDGLNFSPDDPELMFEKGVILDKMGKKQQCLSIMKQVLKIEPNNADALNYIAYTYAELGIKLNEALRLVRKALEIRPDSGYIMDSLGWIFFKKGDYEKAIYYLEKAVQLTPDDPTIREHLGDAYKKKGQYKKAIINYKKALSLNPEQKDKLIKKIEEIMKK